MAPSRPPTTGNDQPESTTPTQSRPTAPASTERMIELARQYTLLERLGTGSFATVYKALHNVTNEVVAIKILNLEESEDDLNEILQEVAVLSQCNSEYTTKYLDSFVVSYELWIVMEYVDGGSCLDLLKAGVFSEAHVATVCRELLLGLEYIHSRGMIHRDIKAANVLLTSSGKVKMADLGTAARFTGTPRRTFIGTPFWMAPEVIRQAGHNNKVDIWGLGITAIELAKGEPPLSEYHPMRVLFLIPKAKPPPLEGPFSVQFKDFVAQCLTKDPKARPSAAELLQHRFIRNARKTSSLAELLEGYQAYRTGIPSKKEFSIPQPSLRVGMMWQSLRSNDWDFGAVTPAKVADKIKSDEGNTDHENDNNKGVYGNRQRNNLEKAVSDIQFYRPSDVPDVLDFLSSVKNALSDNHAAYGRFVKLLGDWSRVDWELLDVTETIEKLVQGISEILRKTPKLFRDFNTLLPERFRIECPTDVLEVRYFSVITPSGARIRCTSGLAIPGNSPRLPTNTAELRVFVMSDRPWEIPSAPLELGWTSCLLQLLQTELDRVQDDEDYRRRCLRYFRKLVQKSGVLPPSFFLSNVVRQGTIDPVWGGGFADIWKGHINGETVCLKVLRLFQTDLNREKAIKLFCREALIWRQLNHPNVLPFYGISTELFQNRLCLISPWMSKGHILSYLEKYPGHDLLATIIQIAHGLRYLHELNPRIVHGDIKGTNVLVADDLRCCLGDFGLVSVMETQFATTATSGVTLGTVRWMAPELLDHSCIPPGGSQTHTASDIYAFGCTVYEIFTGNPPFSELRRDVAVMNAVLAGERPSRPNTTRYLPDEVWLLVEACWAHAALDRPNVGTICEKLEELYNRRKPPYVTDSITRASSQKSLHPPKPSTGTIKKRLVDWLSEQTIANEATPSIPSMSSENLNSVQPEVSKERKDEHQEKKHVTHSRENDCPEDSSRSLTKAHLIPPMPDGNNTAGVSTCLARKDSPLHHVPSPESTLSSFHSAESRHHSSAHSVAGSGKGGASELLVQDKKGIAKIPVAEKRNPLKDFSFIGETPFDQDTRKVTVITVGENQFQLGNCIGRGQYGSVYRTLNLTTGQMVAVKRIRLEGLSEREITQLIKEVNVVKGLSHPCIVKYEGMAKDDNSLDIVLEYAENGSLGQLLRAFGKFDENLVARFVKKILGGINYLHQRHIVHCDLKAANILTDKNGNLKLSDFGHSHYLRAIERDVDRSANIAGTPNWMAPEVIELKGATFKSDIWSLACTVIELMSGRPPYWEIANCMTVMFRIVEDIQPPIPEGCSELLRDFLVRCFHRDPKGRPDAKALFGHPWLTKYGEVDKDRKPFLRKGGAENRNRKTLKTVQSPGGNPPPQAPIVSKFVGVFKHWRFPKRKKPTDLHIPFSANDAVGQNTVTLRSTVIAANLPHKEDAKNKLTINTGGTSFQLGNRISRGRFGSVHKALNLNTGQVVTVKRIRLNGLQEEEVTKLVKEVDSIMCLSHPCIVEYEGMSREGDRLNIVLEYSENNSLSQILKIFGKLNEHLVSIYVAKILDGLLYLHQSDIVHCDLRAANILTTKDGDIKLSDFGVSLNINIVTTLKGNVKLADFGLTLNLRSMEREIEGVARTPNWMAPEVIELKGASAKSDVWSLACTIIELITGSPPYSEMANGMSIMFRIVEDPTPPIPEGCSELLRDFLFQCFNKDPEQRPSVDALCEHAWLKKHRFYYN